MPLASLPVEIAGRNRIQRKMAIKLVEMDGGKMVIIRNSQN
jgi:homoserine O-acetyltransferase